MCVIQLVVVVTGCDRKGGVACGRWHLINECATCVEVVGVGKDGQGATPIP